MNSFYKELDNALNIIKEEGIKKIERYSFRHGIKKIEWYMTDWCNYRCEYCLTDHSKAEFQSLEKLLNIANEIKKLLSKEEKYTLILKGGEVTYFDLETIFHVFDGYNIEFCITTNLSNKAEYYVNLLKKFNLRLNISFHAQAKKEEFLEKVKTIVSTERKNKNITFLFVIGNTKTNELYEEVIGTLENAYKNLKEIKIKKLPLKIKSEPNNTVPILPLINKEKETIINDHPCALNMLDLPFLLDIDPFGYKCYNLYSFFVNKEGDIIHHRCSKKLNSQVVICNKHKCNFCQVGAIEKNETN